MKASEQAQEEHKIEIKSVGTNFNPGPITYNYYISQTPQDTLVYAIDASVHVGISSVAFLVQLLGH